MAGQSFLIVLIANKYIQQTMNHIDEKTLVQYLLDDEKIKDDRQSIEAHLAECAGCKAMFEQIKEYYGEVSQLQQEQPVPSQALTLRRMIVPAFANSAILRAMPKTLPARFVFFVIRHPVVSSFSFFALLLAGVLLLLPQTVVKDTNLAYVRAKEEFLVAYNKSGEELWRKHGGIGYDFERLHRIDPLSSIDNFATAVDVDRDGKKEAITHFGWIPEPIAKKANAIVCYNGDGTERWTYEFNREMTFGNEKFSNDYRFAKMMVGDFDRDGKIEGVAVALHRPYYPAAIVRLDAQEGVLKNEYWHSGASGVVFHTDLEGDGIGELIFAGTNNGFNQADLLVLDPRAINGHAPTPSAYAPIGIEAGREKNYVLFPRTDLSVAGPDKRNGVMSMRMTSDKLLEVTTLEIQGVDPIHIPGMIYYFDSSMRCVRVDANDYFVKAHRKMVEEGKLTKKLNEQYYEELRQGVRYWDGEKFVKEPVMNKRYVESIGRLP